MIDMQNALAIASARLAARARLADMEAPGTSPRRGPAPSPGGWTSGHGGAGLDLERC